MPHDNPLPGHTTLGVLLSLLSAGLAFVNFPSGGVAGATFSTAAQQAPGLAKSMLSTGSLESQLTTLDEIESYLGIVVDQFRINVANTLNATQSDFSYFLSHAANGSFVANQPSLNASVTSLSRFLKTFVVAQTLKSHNIIVTVARDFDVYELSHKPWNGHVEDRTMLPQNAWHVNCQDKPDQYGVCDNWWVDDSTNDAYALFKLDDMEHNYYGLMEAVFGNGWTTGEDLFRGADYCAHYHPQPEEGGLAPFEIQIESTFPWTDPVSLASSCYSNLRVCIWNQTDNLTAQSGSELGDFVGSGGCGFAFPNLCLNGQGFGPPSPNSAASGWGPHPDEFLNRSGILSQNVRSGLFPVGHLVGRYGVQSDAYPASYLGPGLYFNTELCGPLP
ncbi:hypothetical protein ACLMJK_000068 [Lecanora helva]